ncbi:MULTISPECIES: geranylgeranyl reductase family protein [Okeania]|uniref:Geranylgeranyl reductase family protein n=1 Tax=Okeania hirsuta TaxID=1458930 RepID=A0A3N6Q9N2_9CYAN|nr:MULTISPECIES: geranylgeranyl reductase family protein [Okeania]NES88446.1 geranylgeranyl reductase family protein [Okeania sp. SIO2B9]NET76211.1 geranylgeranyl reductase family protein [Okeania sp. SIO1F9]RQH28281.1 geranylgeranyl reductase family protein [Okeania hirsuta]
MFDCIIVGAGPAGGTAAYHLAKKGRSVLVIEKESLPRKKACGGGVSPAIAEWFDFDFTPAISLKVKKIRYTWKLEDPVEADLPSAMWMVKRDIFDHFLIQKAQAEGAELREKTEVTGIEFKSDHWEVKTNGEPVTGRYLIAADGAKGPMAKWLGFKESKKRQSLVFEAALKDQNQQVNFEFGSVKNGNIWSFPKADSCSINIATFRGGEPKNLSKDLMEYAQKIGLSANQNELLEHPISLWDGDKNLHTENAVLAGEAASILDPLSAEGIRPSIFSGVKAAEAIDKALGDDGDALKQYTQVINEEWGADMVWAGRLAGAFYRFPKVAYKMGVKLPAATEVMSKILCGELRYADIANKAIKKLSGSFLPGRG